MASQTLEFAHWMRSLHFYNFGVVVIAQAPGSHDNFCCCLVKQSTPVTIQGNMQWGWSIWYQLIAAFATTARSSRTVKDQNTSPWILSCAQDRGCRFRDSQQVYLEIAYERNKFCPIRGKDNCVTCWKYI